MLSLVIIVHLNFQNPKYLYRGQSFGNCLIDTGGTTNPNYTPGSWDELIVNSFSVPPGTAGGRIDLARMTVNCKLGTFVSVQRLYCPCVGLSPTPLALPLLLPFPLTLTAA